MHLCSNSYFGTVVAQDQPLGFLSENEAPFQDVIYDIDDVDDMFHIISRCPTFLIFLGGCYTYSIPQRGPMCRLSWPCLFHNWLILHGIFGGSRRYQVTSVPSCVHGVRGDQLPRGVLFLFPTFIGYILSSYNMYNIYIWYVLYMPILIIHLCMYTNVNVITGRQ